MEKERKYLCEIEITSFFDDNDKLIKEKKDIISQMYYEDTKNKNDKDNCLLI